MPSNYPGSLDALTNPDTTDPLTAPSHAGQHANANDAIEAVQAALGVDLNNLPKGQIAYASAAVSQTGIGTTETDVTGLTVTPTLAANRRVRVSTWMRLVAAVAPNSAIVRIKKGGADFQVSRWHMAATGTTGNIVAYVSITYTTTAETVTFKTTLASSSSTIDTVATTSALAELMVEDLGPA